MSYPQDCTGWGENPITPLALAHVVIRHFPPAARLVAYALAAAESGRNPSACGDRSYFIAGVPYWSIGLWQVLTYVRPGRYDFDSLFDPDYNAAAAMDISHGGTDWCPWSTYEEGCGRGHTGRYRDFLDEAATALGAAGGGVIVPPDPPPPDQGGLTGIESNASLILGGALLAAAGLSLARVVR